MVIPWLIALGLACAPAIRINSQPIGVVLDMEDGTRLVTPTTVQAPRWPMRRPQVRVSATGYRSIDLKIPYAWHDEWSIVMIPEHGPAGSWDESDLP